MIPAVLLGLAAQIAPALVRGLTGSARAAEVAEAVVGVVEAATGQPARTEAEAAQAVRALQADPAAWAQVQVALAGLAAREMELDHADRANARERDAKVRGTPENWRANIMLSLALAGLVVAMWLAFAYPDASADARSLVLLVAGALLKMVGDAFAFEFGSSRGSAEKQRTIEAMTRADDSAGGFRRG